MRNRHLIHSIASILPVFLLADKDATGGGSPSPNTFAWTIPEIEETADLELKNIITDAGTQGRVTVDQGTIEEYTEVIKAARKAEQLNPFDQLSDHDLPAVFRDPEGHCVLAGGFQRYAAHKKAGEKTLRVSIRPGTKRDALLFALQDNATHGLKRTNKDKLRALRIVEADEELSALKLSNAAIATIINTSVSFVQQNRSAAKSPGVRKVTRGGKTYEQKTGDIGKNKGKGKSPKPKKAEKAKKGEPKPSKLEELDREIRKITNVIGGDEGAKIRKALEDGSLPLTPLEIRTWAGVTDGTIKKITPLVTGASRLKPSKALDLLQSDLPEKVVEDLHLRAIGNGGTFTFKAKGVEIVVTHTGK